ncbi:MAG: hypothetical protein CVT90_02580 [Candidatus Altiarchaeales archaeon HGW-Altiarchaeales-3]|nr:MAG: hypothetical protein CVT90_02580 [Candidatus Altiarchaeales archaeon HGW-Altiarchaeales-3]
MRKKPLIILLGGSSGVGTSTTAIELSKKLDITHIVETDYLREVLRGVIMKEYSPILHRSSYSAYESLPNYDWLTEAIEFERIVFMGFTRHVSMVTPAVRRLINRAIDEMNNLIIEGVHLNYAELDLDSFKKRAEIYPFILKVDEETHKERFLKRALERRRGGNHLNYFKEIRITHDYLIKGAEDEGIHVVDATKPIPDVNGEILSYIKHWKYIRDRNGKDKNEDDDEDNDENNL